MPFSSLTKIVFVCSMVMAFPAVFSGCSNVNHHYDPDKSHHTPRGFKNRYPHAKKDGGDFLRWQWERFRADLPKPPERPIKPVEPDLELIQSNPEKAAVTWVGHATVLLQVGGRNVLTDPQFSDRASPLSFAGPPRHQRPGVALSDLPRIDIVVISHNHYDHLDESSVRRLYQQAGGPPQFFIPLGVDAWFRENITNGDDTHLSAMDWWESRDHDGFTIQFLPVQHWSSRTPWDKMETLWGAWAVKHPTFSFLFGGDFGYSKDLSDVGRRTGGFDLAAIPVGAYEPRWFMKTFHVNPAEAVQAHLDLNARQSLGIHWGTFEGLTDEPLDQPPEDLARARDEAGVSENAFFLLQHGETFRP